jgi:hypothetical protein
MARNEIPRWKKGIIRKKQPDKKEIIFREIRKEPGISIGKLQEKLKQDPYGMSRPVFLKNLKKLRKDKRVKSQRTENVVGMWTVKNYARPGPVLPRTVELSKEDEASVRTSAELGISAHYLLYDGYSGFDKQCKDLAKILSIALPISPKNGKPSQEDVDSAMQDMHRKIDRLKGDTASSAYDLTRFACNAMDKDKNRRELTLQKSRESIKERILAELAEIGAEEDIQEYVARNLPKWVSLGRHQGREEDTLRNNFRLLFQLLNKYVVQYRLFPESEETLDFFARNYSIRSSNFAESARRVFTLDIGTVRIVSGKRTFKSLSDEFGKKCIRVGRGDLLTGTVELETQNNMLQRAQAPLIQVASWLPVRTGWTVVNEWIEPGRHRYFSKVNLIAPQESGKKSGKDYHIIFAFRGETRPECVASSTNWSPFHTPIWDDGNDLAQLSSNEIVKAQASGHIYGNEELLEFGYVPFDLPLDAVKILVE